MKTILLLTILTLAGCAPSIPTSQCRAELIWEANRLDYLFNIYKANQVSAKGAMLLIQDEADIMRGKAARLE